MQRKFNLSFCSQNLFGHSEHNCCIFYFKQNRLTSYIDYSLAFYIKQSTISFSSKKPCYDVAAVSSAILCLSFSKCYYKLCCFLFPLCYLYFYFFYQRYYHWFYHYCIFHQTCIINPQKLKTSNVFSGSIWGYHEFQSSNLKIDCEHITYYVLWKMRYNTQDFNLKLVKSQIPNLLNFLKKIFKKLQWSEK